jgi:hypothetical protein
MMLGFMSLNFSSFSFLQCPWNFAVQKVKKCVESRPGQPLQFEKKTCYGLRLGVVTDTEIISKVFVRHLLYLIQSFVPWNHWVESAGIEPKIAWAYVYCIYARPCQAVVAVFFLFFYFFSYTKSVENVSFIELL